MRLPFHISSIPRFGENSFAGIRKYDIHTGVDLFCEVGQPVLAMESGIVVNVLPFTGAKAESPWWLETDAVMIEGESGVFLYGEIETSLKVGEYVQEGQLVGKVVRVLKNDKGKPVTMLHLELYQHGTRDCVWWKLNERCPEQLLDPTAILISLIS
jgi:murein DD-endopeptidase MepM/ murein hydrolase activator NlpD